MQIVTDSYQSVLNEDGSTTTTEVYTTYPMTKGEKITSSVLLGGLVAVPIVIAVAPLARDLLAERRERRKAKKTAKQNEK